VVVPPENREFAARARDSLEIDPGPTLNTLSCQTGVPVDVLTHLALVRWASAGAEALMSMEPAILDELVQARKQEDWQKVAGIIDWLESGR
jgi:hypothetical protein